MIKALATALQNTNNRIWRTYEWVSIVVLAISFTCVSVFLIGAKPELAWTVKIFIMLIISVVFVDVLKYKITGSAKDKPLRKWFSVRWAQRYKPEEILIPPNDFTGDVTHLKRSRCNRCGAFHGFSGEEGESKRICSFRGCKELVSSSDEYAQLASKIFRKKEERSAIFAEVRLTPFRFLYQHSWAISEHIFKLFSWMLVACTVLAVGQHKNNNVIEYAGIFFCVLWIINFLITCFRAMIFVQDEMIEWSNKDEENRTMKHVISFTVTMSLVLVMLLLIRVTLNLFSEVFSYIPSF